MDTKDRGSEDEEEDGVLAYQDKEENEELPDMTLHDASIEGQDEAVVVTNTPLGQYLKSLNNSDIRTENISLPPSAIPPPPATVEAGGGFTFVLAEFFPILYVLHNPYRKCLVSEDIRAQLSSIVFILCFFCFLTLAMTFHYFSRVELQFISLCVAVFLLVNTCIAVWCLQFHTMWLASQHQFDICRLEFRENGKLVRKAIKRVMEVEMVSRGYHLSPSLAAVVRLDSNAPDDRRHSRYLRSVLCQALNGLLYRFQQGSTFPLLPSSPNSTPTPCSLIQESATPSVAAMRGLYQMVVSAEQTFCDNFTNLQYSLLERPRAFFSRPPSLAAIVDRLDELRTQIRYANDILSVALQPMPPTATPYEEKDELRNLIVSAYSRLLLARQRCLEATDETELKRQLEEDAEYVCAVLKDVKSPDVASLPVVAQMFGQQEQSLLAGSLEAALSQLRETKLDDGSGEVFSGAGALAPAKNQYPGSDEPSASAFAANLAIVKELQSVLRHRQVQTTFHVRSGGEDVSR